MPFIGTETIFTMTTEQYFTGDTMINADAEEMGDDAIAGMEDFDEDGDDMDELGGLDDGDEEM